jgi:hypothetical protein
MQAMLAHDLNENRNSRLAHPHPARFWFAGSRMGPLAKAPFGDLSSRRCIFGGTGKRGTPVEERAKVFGYTKRQALFWDPYVSVSWLPAPGTTFVMTSVIRFAV